MKDNVFSTGRNSHQCAALLIDMQPCIYEFFPSSLYRPLIAAQCETLQIFRHYDVPVVQIEMIGEGKTIPPLEQMLGKMRHIERVEKSHYSAFSNSSLQDILTHWDARNLIIMGIYASCCVLETAYDASKLNYSGITAENLIGDNFPFYFQKSEDEFRRIGQYFPSHIEMCSALFCTAKKNT